ncbi:unnamed protein product [Schistosoma rodhaini]|uniref:Mitochondrial carnitine/acylcarnitine carrier protein n=1 Tax=Schistosoma rodhaini TaxID=6188 RepID=A0AA85FIZ0_9TREM|nr:unnamed protein product [Schistosoma rodhaini]
MSESGVQVISPIKSFLAGGFGGACCIVIGHPFDTIKVQSNAIGPLKYSGPVDVLRQLYREGGIRSIFKGTAATLLRDVPASGVYFLSYEVMKNALRNPHSKNNELSVGKTLFAGGMAGIFNWLIAIPPDVLKSRLQSGTFCFGIYKFKLLYKITLLKVFIPMEFDRYSLSLLQKKDFWDCIGA